MTLQGLEKRSHVRQMVIVVFVLASCIAGCASVSVRRGRWHLEREEYPQALAALKSALGEDPDNPEIHRDLGIAYYKMEDYSQALDELMIAKQKLEKDGSLIFYLGLTYEQQGEYEKAIEEYSNYIRLSRFRGMRQKIRKRVEHLIRQQAEQWAKNRKELEDRIDPASIPDNAVAVTYFKPIEVPKELEPLYIGLTDLLINDLKYVEDLKILERLELRKICDELGFSSTELADHETAPRPHKLLGANALVTGAFSGFGDEMWRVDPILMLVKIESPEHLTAVGGKVVDFLRAEKDLVLEVLAKLNIELTDEERGKILANRPTESLAAFLVYSRGLDYLDRGMYSEAKAEFESATSLDPGFSLAKQYLIRAELLSQPMDSIEDLEDAWESESSSHEMTSDLLATTLRDISRGDVERVPPTEPKIRTEVKIRIEWNE